MRNKEYLNNCLIPVLLTQWVRVNTNTILPINAIQSPCTNTIYLSTADRTETQERDWNFTIITTILLNPFFPLVYPSRLNHARYFSYFQ